MLNPGFIWGAILIILGVTILINVIFGINLPIFRILAAGFLIYLGITMLMPQQKFFFSSYSFDEAETVTHLGSNTDYTIAFGKRFIDLSELELSDEQQTININCNMGSVKIKLNPDIPTKIIAHAHLKYGSTKVSTHSSFSEVIFPDHSTHTMGTATYLTHPNETPKLIINVNVSFGSVKFVK